MPKKTHLYRFHKEGGKLIEFSGFEMPLWYKGIVEEHGAVRNSVGIFDVSHMGRLLIEGRDATKFLDFILPTNVEKMKDSRAFYSAICNERGGIIDDSVTNRFSSSKYMMVVNAANIEKDLRWLESHASGFEVSISNSSENSALIAIQGPLARATLQKICDVDLGSMKRFAFSTAKVAGVECIVSRTGYTGEDGFEITVLDTPLDSPAKAERVWESLLEAGKEYSIQPCGLGARDLLRLEAGMCLYGQDLNDDITPIEASLSSIVSQEKSVEYVGRKVIDEQIRNGTSRIRVGFVMTEDGIPRHEFDVVLGGVKVGVVTSGSFSPILKKGIGMAYVPRALSEIGQKFMIKIRNLEREAQVTRMPFYDTSKYGITRKTSSST